MSGEKTGRCWKRIGIWGDRSCPDLVTHGHCRNCAVYSREAVRLLDVPVSGDYRKRGAEYFARTKEEKTKGGKLLMVFQLSGERFALPATAISEVAPRSPVRTLPKQRESIVEGIASVRGELLVCVSLARVLGLDDSSRGSAAQCRHLVIGHEAQRLVLSVESIDGFHRYEEADLLSVPATLAQARAIHTRGLLTCEGFTVGLLDDGLLMHTLNRGLA